MALDNSNFIFKWESSTEKRIKVNRFEKVLVEYKDENGNIIQDYKEYNPKENAYFWDFKEYKFFQPYVSKEYKASLEAEKIQVNRDLIHLAGLYKSLLEDYHRIESKKDFRVIPKNEGICDSYTERFYAEGHFGVIKLKVDITPINKKYKSDSTLKNVYTLEKIHDFELLFKDIKRRMALFQKYYSEVIKALLDLYIYPVDKNEQEILEGLLRGVIQQPITPEQKIEALLDIMKKYNADI